MNDNINLRADRISKYQARLKHLDELLERARKKNIEATEHKNELKEIVTKREELADYIGEMKRLDPEHWQQEEIEKAGPMGLWDSVAQQLEKLVERFEKKK